MNYVRLKSVQSADETFLEHSEKTCGKLFSLFIRACEPGNLRLSSTPTQRTLCGLRLQAFRQAGPPQRIDCLAQRSVKLRFWCESFFAVSAFF